MDRLEPLADIRFAHLRRTLACNLGCKLEHKDMRTSLEHLPEAKRQDIAWALKVLFKEFEASVAFGTSEHKRSAEILKVVLFGSYATGKWVDDPVGGYFSDYDLLVVVNDPKLTDLQEYWVRADERLARDYLVSHRLSAPVSFIVHDLADVNEKLRLGRYFFVDVLRDGISLYEASGHPFDQPQALAPAEALREAEGYFEEWFGSAGRFVHLGMVATRDGMPKEAAFLFHQAAERLYVCALLVATLYSPKTHRLNFLRSQAEQLDPRLMAAWPREKRSDRRCFELLRRAYVEARYSPHYKINERELTWISERVAILQDLVEAVCRERLAGLAGLAGLAED